MVSFQHQVKSEREKECTHRNLEVPSSILMLTMFLCNSCSSTLYPTSSTLNIFNHHVHNVSQNMKKIMSNPMPIMFSMCFFNTRTIAYCYFVIPCQNSLLLLFFLLFLIFRHSWCCSYVFLLLIKFRSFLNKKHCTNLNFK